jgi:hypothetical protein
VRGGEKAQIPDEVVGRVKDVSEVLQRGEPRQPRNRRSSVAKESISQMARASHDHAF